MKQKLRKFTNGFYPPYDMDPEEMPDSAMGSDSLLTDNKDTLNRLSQHYANIISNSKLFTTDKHGEMLLELKAEIQKEHSLLTSTISSVDDVAIYRVAKWSKEKIERELLHYKELLSEMDTHEEIIKMLTNICSHIDKATVEEEDTKDDINLTDYIKQIQNILYKLWLRLLEWECLLEQQQLGHLMQVEILTDNNDEGEEVLKTTAGNLATDVDLIIATERIQRLPSNLSCDIPDITESEKNDEHYKDHGTLNNSDYHECDLLRNVAQTDTSIADQQCEKIDNDVRNATKKQNMSSGLCVNLRNDQTKLSHHQSLPLAYDSSQSSPSSMSPASSICSKSISSSPLGKVDLSDSDSGVSDLSSDLTFFKNSSKISLGKNYTPLESQVSKSSIDFTRKSKMSKKYQDLSQSRKLMKQMQNNFYDGLLYWVKLIFLIVVIFLLIVFTFVLSHVKCFNDICAISIETKVHYYKYASPI